MVESFGQFNQLQTQQGFYSFSLRTNAFKILPNPPKCFTQWISKFFFYVKEAAVACKQHFKSDLSPNLQPVPVVASPNRELQFLRMMLLFKPGVRKKLVYRGKGEVVRFWKTFAEDFEGKIVVEDCAEGEERWYETTVACFRVPAPAALNAPLPQGQGK
ncbi:hypothetical protein Hanom_Chr08g00737961 [Helianthus anomalus]